MVHYYTYYDNGFVYIKDEKYSVGESDFEYLDSVYCRKIGYDFCKLTLRIDTESSDTLITAKFFQKKIAIGNSIVIEKIIDKPNKSIRPIISLEDYRKISEKDKDRINPILYERYTWYYKKQVKKLMIENLIDSTLNKTLYFEDIVLHNHLEDTFSDCKNYLERWLNVLEGERHRYSNNSRPKIEMEYYSQ